MKVQEINLLGDRVLIKPLKQFTYKVVQQRPKKSIPTGDKINLDEIPEVDPNEMEDFEMEIAADIQKAEVLAVGDFKNYSADSVPCKVGDIILYHRKSGVMFEMIKNAVLLKHYDIIGIVKK